jgi:hypothetical protein
MTAGCEDIFAHPPVTELFECPGFKAFEHFNNDRALRMIKDLWYKNSVFLLSVGRHLHGFERRRHRRFPGPDAQARLSQRPGHYRDLVDAVSEITPARTTATTSATTTPSIRLSDRWGISSNSRMAQRNAASV